MTSYPDSCIDSAILSVKSTLSLRGVDSFIDSLIVPLIRYIIISSYLPNFSVQFFRPNIVWLYSITQLSHH